jgi:U4/U6 small nuclear ribonucleoprotein PRP31
MSIVAPNVTSLVGSSTAAKMMSLAGGLVNLSRMSPATLETLGSNRKALSGLSTSNLRVNGFLADCEFVQKTPSDLRRKAVKLLSGKYVKIYFFSC